MVTHEAQYQDEADDGSNFPLDKDVVAKSQNNIAYAGLGISRCALLKQL